MLSPSDPLLILYTSCTYHLMFVCKYLSCTFITFNSLQSTIPVWPMTHSPGWWWVVWWEASGRQGEAGFAAAPAEAAVAARRLQWHWSGDQHLSHNLLKRWDKKIINQATHVVVASSLCVYLFTIRWNYERKRLLGYYTFMHTLQKIHCL